MAVLNGDAGHPATLQDRVALRRRLARSAISRPTSPAETTAVTEPTDSPAYSAMASIVPVVPRDGGDTENLGTGIRRAPMGISPTMSSVTAWAASTQERSTRWGAS